MNYNESVLKQVNEVIQNRGLQADIRIINDISYEVIVTIDGQDKSFTTPKLAKIYLQNYTKRDIIISDDIPTSGLVGQKNDEAPKKRRGRPKKADNDRNQI